MSHTVLALSGSLRSGSSNTGLIRLAERITRSDPNLGLQIVIVDSLDSLPFYNADLEDANLTPSSVRDLRARIDDCAGLFIASPEYNFGPTALLKNAIDWVSRPLGQHALRGKAISLVSSSASTGGKHITEQLTTILTLLGNTVIEAPEALFVKGAERIFSDGTTSDPNVEEVVRARLIGLAEQLRSA
jgi:chromate reductase